PPPQGVPVPPATHRPPSTAPAPVPAAPFRLEGEPELDIGLAVDLDRLEIAPKPMAEGSTRTTETLRAERNVTTPPTVEPASGGARCSWKARDGSTIAVTASAAETLWVEPAGAARLGWSGKTWRGRMKVFLGPRGRLTLAVRLPLETYLLGVVPGEIGG